MRTKIFLRALGFTAMVMTLLFMGCSKVRDVNPEKDPKVIDASGKAHHLNGPPPVITCDEAEYDFGTVTQGEDAKHIFVIKNKGKGVLKIDRARGG